MRSPIINSIAIILLSAMMTLLLFSVTLDGAEARGPGPQRIPVHRRHPEDKCGGKRMYYVPLVRLCDLKILGACDSSCSPPPLAASYFCNKTTTLPRAGYEDDDEAVRRFPFHTLTCWTRVEGEEKGVEIENRFREACDTVNGSFVSPLYPYW